MGETSESCEQAGQAFVVRLKVSPTPNPSFRRVDAQVLANASPVLRLSTVMGRY
jgi:general secretion pathway protein I